MRIRWEQLDEDRSFVLPFGEAEDGSRFILTQHQAHDPPDCHAPGD